MSLVDSWRSTHPTEKDYSYYSAPHQRYSRLDLIFITQRDLPRLARTEKGIISLSDHAPVALSLKPGSSNRRSFNWRLNAALLTDQTIQDYIHDSIRSYFLDNKDSDTNPLNNWEAHKTVIRGNLIRWGALRKKERDKEIASLSNKIAHLEM